MTWIDWAVMATVLAGMVAYGVWRGRGNRDLQGYLLAGRAMPWPMVALSVMATQASAITFLSTPGQGYADGLRFVQFYFGLPLAMVVLCVTLVPLFHRLKVFTAYEYLETRFDAKTRALATLLFLTQRGLAAGLTIYAPSLIFSVVLGIDVHVVCMVLGGLVVTYTAWGGSKAVSHTHALQFSIIMAATVLAFVLVVLALPRGVGFMDALRVAGHTGKLNAIDTSFDLNNRYNLWSGLIGGFFLQLAYFGTDQSQVGRYLTGRSVAQSRLGLLFNGLAKVPMQFFILLLGVMVFVFYLFTPPPAFFNPVEVRKIEASPWAGAYRDRVTRQQEALADRGRAARDLVEAQRSGDRARLETAEAAIVTASGRAREARDSTVAVMRRNDPGMPANDVNYVFLHFVLHQLPIGIIGLVLAAIFAASMNSTSAELNALASTTVVDVWKRMFGGGGGAIQEVWVSRFVTLGWGIFAVGFAESASRLGSLVEAVNILGSLFYGTILGIFLTAFFLPRVGGTAVFVAALVAEAAVIAAFKLTPISFLWYNVIGCLIVVGLSHVLSAVLAGRGSAPGPRPA